MWHYAGVRDEPELKVVDVWYGKTTTVLCPTAVPETVVANSAGKPRRPENIHSCIHYKLAARSVLVG